MPKIIDPGLLNFQWLTGVWNSQKSLKKSFQVERQGLVHQSTKLNMKLW